MEYRLLEASAAGVEVEQHGAGSLVHPRRRLCVPQTARAEHAARTSSDCLGAALLLAALAPAMRPAVLRAACSSSLGAALLLAALAPAMRLAVLRASRGEG
jgi:hypothetical protein